MCHPDHRGMSTFKEGVVNAAKEIRITPQEVEETWRRMKLWYPDLFGDINGDKYCPGGLTVVNKDRHTGKPKIVRYGPDVDGRIRQKF